MAAAVGKHPVLESGFLIHGAASSVCSWTQEFKDGLRGSRTPGGSVLSTHAKIYLFLNYYIYYY